MPKVKVYNQEGAEVGSQELSEKIFGVKPKVSVVHQVATAMMANRRQVLAHTKDRGEVRGGGRKPWRQKGTGRARHGSIRSPLWVGGGVTFGPTKERNFKKKVNDKMRRKAIFMCLSDRLTDDKLVLIDKLNIEDGKTKNIVKLIDALKDIFYRGDEKKQEIKKLSPPSEDQPKAENKETKGTNDVNKKKTKIKIKPKKILVLVPEKDEKIAKSCRNIKWLKCLRAQDVNVLDILANEYILMSVDGVKKIEQIFHANKNAN